MRAKHHLPLLLALILLSACLGQASPESFAIQQPSPSPEVIIFTPTLKIADVIPTHTLVPTATAQNLPTQTPTLVDLESLPKLRELIISSTDSEKIDEFSDNSLLLVTDATSELQDSCLWDCVKYRYSLEQGTLTIVLLRAGDPKKAESTVENLRTDFLKTVGVEYSADDITSMPSKSWVLVDAASSVKDFRTSAAGIAHASIVILVTYSQIFCEYTPELGRYCEGNLMGLALTSVVFLKAQVQKLETGDYPK